jgi:ABC-2 type transport system permease protein
LAPSIVVAAILIVYLAPGGSQGLLLALPGLVAIPVVSLIPGLMEEYLPLSRPAARGDQSSRNMSLMFLTMIAMAGVLAIAYIAWTFDVVWYVLAIELLVSGVLYRILNQMIRNRPLARPV